MSLGDGNKYFRAWVESLPDATWAKKDLSACKLGWDAALDAAWPDIKTMQQALLEMKHAQAAGPGWYTNGEAGLKKQVRLWLDKGLKASESLNKLRGE